MMMRPVVAACLVLTATVTALPSGGLVQYFRALEKQQRKEVALFEKTKKPGTQDDLFLEQKLDHLDGASTATFQQRYFVNASFFTETDATAPVFLCVGGEGPALDASVLSHSVHCSDMTELAPRVGALMFALEHRYYGASVPPKAPRTFLSSKQAVYDIADFVGAMTAAYNLTETNKWVTFGGSYPGMVSGFARLKLPHLIHASVSSSSPWKAKVDMQEYNDVVGRALTIASVGGSDECLEIVADGHATLAEYFAQGANASLQQAAQTFNFCDPDALLDPDTFKNWAGYGVIDVPAQENDPADDSPAGNIESICSTLLATDGDNLDKLAAVSSLQNGDRCLGATTTTTASALLASALRSVSPARSSLDDLGAFGAASDALSWPWQTCTEFGFYQTCEVGSDCPFAQGFNTLEDEIGMCQTLFNISTDQVAANVDFANLVYGSDAPRATRILFPNGNVDPWSGLGVLDSPDGNVSEIVFYVEGASHHAWTHPADTIVQQSVTNAKLFIQDTVVAWLQEDD